MVWTGRKPASIHGVAGWNVCELAANYTGITQGECGVFGVRVLRIGQDIAHAEKTAQRRFWRAGFQT
jgi:hypothetical protein